MARPQIGPLKLEVKRGKWRMDDLHSGVADEKFAATREKVLARDRHACLHCGFRADKYQEVHHLNDNHADNREGNLATVCPLCHASHHIGFAGQRGAVLVWWPEISQEDFNHLLRTIWVAIVAGDDNLKSKAKNLHSLIEHRRQYVLTMLGTDSPVDVANALLHVGEDQAARVEESLSGVRLMVSAASFENAISYWVNTTYRSIPPEVWAEMIQGKA